MKDLKVQNSKLIEIIQNNNKFEYYYIIQQQSNYYLLSVIYKINTSYLTFHIVLLKIGTQDININHQIFLLIIKQRVLKSYFNYSGISIYVNQNTLHFKQNLYVTLSSMEEYSWLNMLKNKLFYNFLFFHKTVQSHHKLLINIRSKQQQRQIQKIGFIHALSCIDNNQKYQQCKVTINFTTNDIQKYLDQNIKSQQFLSSMENIYHSQKVFDLKYLKNHLIPYFQTQQKHLKQFGDYYRSEDNRIDDYLYNMVKIDLKNMIGGGQPIAEGGSGRIYVARVQLQFICSSDLQPYHTDNNKRQTVIAIKKLLPHKEATSLHKLQHQKKILAKLKSSVCPFINKYYQCESQNKQLKNAILMEYIKGDQLTNFLINNRYVFQLWSKLFLLLNIVQGVRHLINYKITHLDLKPCNIIISKNLVPKIIDFGQAYHPDICSKVFKPGFTFPYASPEIYTHYLKLTYGKKYQPFDFSEKQDVFAFGLMMAQIIFNKKLMNIKYQLMKQVYIRKIYLQKIFISYEMFQSYGQKLMMISILTLIFQCIDPEPINRPSFLWIYIKLKYIFQLYTKYIA